VHVGQPVPTPLAVADALARTDSLESKRPARHQRSSAPSHSGIEWQQHGIEPRWLGMETSDCGAALDPSIFHGHGADELERFLAGTRSRQETAIVIATIGDAEDNSKRSVLSRYDASVSLPGFHGAISGRRLPAGTRLALATELSRADRDLGLRLLSRPSEAPWSAPTLSGLTHLPGAGGASITYAPKGELHPILVAGPHEDVGDPVGDPHEDADDPSPPGSALDVLVERSSLLSAAASPPASPGSRIAARDDHRRNAPRAPRRSPPRWRSQGFPPRGSPRRRRPRGQSRGPWACQTQSASGLAKPIARAPMAPRSRRPARPDAMPAASLSRGPA
jgi:hypothetical protein